jgi:dTDP-4-amino-4,6-dideoxygalactose transaminase
MPACAHLRNMARPRGRAGTPEKEGTRTNVMPVPFFRPTIGEEEVTEVQETMRSGWLTTGPRVKRFETEFAQAVGAKHAIALGSCTAALHLALEALGVQRGEGVIVPTMTFAATAEVVRYFDAIPVFVDCDPATLCPDPASIRAALDAMNTGRPWPGVPAGTLPPRVLINMHYGGLVGAVEEIAAIAAQHSLQVVDDAAHTMPSWSRPDEGSPWIPVGAGAAVTCFSFYANKCITTGEGGMATTDSDALADRMRLMSLHGMDRDAWKRFTDQGSWYYEVVAPGFKYNMTDVAAAIGIHQLAKHETLWRRRQSVAIRFGEALARLPIELPTERPHRRHSWHLYSVKLELDRLTIDRDRFLDELRALQIGHAVHWRPLHMMPYYRDRFGLRAGDFPVAASLWPRLVSLPIFAGMSESESDEVIRAVGAVCERHRR